MTGQDHSTGLVAQTIVFRRLRSQATDNDGLPHCLAIGLPVSLAARTVSSMLFGIQPADPLAFLATAGVLGAIGLAAAFVPARRATRIVPAEIPRYE